MLLDKNIEYIIIHCSDTPDDEDWQAIDIHKMHLDFDWNGIGYHKVITKNGDIQNGRPEFWVGAHTKGKNYNSLGVCLIGKNKFNKKQFSSLKIILDTWKKKYPNAVILGHCEAIKTHKTCPNFDVQKWLKSNELI